MLFSTATGYALRTLASFPEDGSYTLARVVARDLNLPGPYLAKILQTLVQAGILESVRGPKGGFRMAKQSTHVTVGEVMEVLEGPDALEGCVMGFPLCGSDNPCPLHIAWSEVKAQLNVSLTDVTVRDLKALNSRNPMLAGRAMSTTR